MDKIYKNKNSPIQEMLSGASISLFFGTIGFALMFLFKTLLARIYGPEDYGVFEMGNTFLNIGSIIALLGINSGITRYIPAYEERGDHRKLNGYLSFIFRVPVALSVLVAFLMFISSEEITVFFNFNQNFISVIKIISLSLPLRIVNEIIYQVFFAKKKVFIQNISFHILEKIILVIGLFSAVILNLEINKIVWFIFLSNFGALILNIIYLKTKINFVKSDFEINSYKEWIFFSIPLFMGGMSSFFMRWTDNLVIGKIMDSANLGIYATSFSLASFLLFFQASFVSIFVPIMTRLYVRMEEKLFCETYIKVQNWVFGAVLPFAAFFLFFSDDLMGSVYGEQYLVGSLPLIIITVALTFNVFTGMNSSLIKIAKDTKYLFYVKIFMAAVSVVLNILLVKKLGIIGAAISTSTAIVLEQVMYLIKSKKYFPIQHNNLKNLKLMATSFLLALAFRFALPQLNIITIMPVIFVYISVYLVIVWLANIFDKSDIVFISNIFRKNQEYGKS